VAVAAIRSQLDFRFGRGGSGIVNVAPPGLRVRRERRLSQVFELIEVQVEDRRLESVVPVDVGGFVELETGLDGVSEAGWEGDHALLAGRSDAVVIGEVVAAVADAGPRGGGDGTDCHGAIEKERDWR
jgi:hypothetical protein